MPGEELGIGIVPRDSEKERDPSCVRMTPEGRRNLESWGLGATPCDLAQDATWEGMLGAELFVPLPLSTLRTPEPLPHDGDGAFHAGVGGAVVAEDAGGVEGVAEGLAGLDQA